ncbi:DNA polymerase III subunit beta [Candidatus Rariloculus sp.]|uniref:DNA polymerase III subunit beta n=1 Tax=Candidatus Rariloculus sp. TaxID=3101265 RepID=UPI003D0E0D61
MKFSAPREALLKLLQAVVGVVERRSTMPILSNVLLRVADGKLSVTATDLEVELVAGAAVDEKASGEITVPGRKFHDICRLLPEGTVVDAALSGNRMVIKGGRGRYTLATLSAADFPIVEEIDAQVTLRMPQQDLQALLHRTQFSMAQQDVRYYLNGLLLETGAERLRAVATDGHRLALSETALSDAVAHQQVIVPRKGILELNRLLGTEGELLMMIGAKHVRIEYDGLRMTSTLIDGRFPDYTRVIPEDPANSVLADRELLRNALQRAAVLANDKLRGVRLELDRNSIVIYANNPEQEEAIETLEVEYEGDAMEVGFNVNYLLDALGVVESDVVQLGLTDGDSSCLITPRDNIAAKYVVMPMRL